MPRALKKVLARVVFDRAGQRRRALGDKSV
jgi:hypothetical protein